MRTQRTNPRRRFRAALAVAAALTATAAGLLSPAPASAAPTSAAEARAQMEKAAQQLTAIDEQVQQAQVAVDQRKKAAATAAADAAKAQAALQRYEPQLRAIAQTYTGHSQSRVAVFLTSSSATDMVQQMTTLDMIAQHTESVIAEVAAAQDAAAKAQATADKATAEAQRSLDRLQQQKTALQQKADAYQAQYTRLSASERAAVNAALAGPTLSAPTHLAVAPSAAAGIAVRTALAHVGDPYVWGKAGPDGFDCSGLTSFAYAAAGVAIPHSSGAQSQLGREIPRNQLQPGDIVYFYSPVSHVGLYIGGGMMVHARTFGQPVAVTSVDQAGYRGARRIVGP